MTIVRTITVLREFRPAMVTICGGQPMAGHIVSRDCGLGCTCESRCIRLEPGADAAAGKTFCFNDLTREGISEIAGSAVALEEGPDVWRYEVQANLVRMEASDLGQPADPRHTEPPAPLYRHFGHRWLPVRRRTSDFRAQVHLDPARPRIAYGPRLRAPGRRDGDGVPSRVRVDGRWMPARWYVRLYYFGDFHPKQAKLTAAGRRQMVRDNMRLHVRGTDDDIPF